MSFRRGFERLRRFVHSMAGRPIHGVSDGRRMVFPLPDGAGAFVVGDALGAGSAAADSYEPGSAYSRIPTTFSTSRSFGADQITDRELDFVVKREPVIHWMVWYVAQDIFDNGFRVYIEGREQDDDFDRSVQRVLRGLDAKKALVRSTAFERLYGTSIIVCSYRGSGSWEDSIYDAGMNLKPGLELLQLTPYPWSQVNVTEYEANDENLRYGLPRIYEVTRSDGTTFRVHWSKVIHDAPRRFDDPVVGMSVVQILYDDATGFRNMRWGLYQTIFRYGSGFPHIHLPWASRKQITDLINGGEFDYINSRGLFVTGGKEENKETIEFIGVKGVSLNPDPYVKVAFESFALGSRVPQDILKGVSAGRITGSEVNERNYYKYISSEQTTKEGVVRELIDRLIETGQIEPSDKRVKFPPESEYLIDWYSAFELNEVDQTRIRLWESTTYKNFGAFMTIDEIRGLNKLKPLPDGEGAVVLELKRLETQAMRGMSQVRPGQTQPSEGEVQGNRPEER